MTDDERRRRFARLTAEVEALHALACRGQAAAIRRSQTRSLVVALLRLIARLRQQVATLGHDQ